MLAVASLKSRNSFVGIRYLLRVARGYRDFIELMINSKTLHLHFTFYSEDTTAGLPASSCGRYFRRRYSNNFYWKTLTKNYSSEIIYKLKVIYTYLSPKIKKLYLKFTGIYYIHNTTYRYHAKPETLLTTIELCILKIIKNEPFKNIFCMVSSVSCRSLKIGYRVGYKENCQLQKKDIGIF